MKNVGISYKALALLMAAVLVLGGAIGGTIAWLTDKTSETKNTFTESDISISLTESTNDYKMIPGHTIDKDPKVTVTADSEDCYLFIKIEKSDNYDTYLANYAIDSAVWTALDDEDGVYYKTVKKADTTREFSILAAGSYTSTVDDEGNFTWTANQVLVKPEVTKAQMNELKTDSTKRPTLTFTAYAVQLYKTNDTEFTAAEAWAKAQAMETA